MHIPFNKPYLSGKEITYILQAAENGKLFGYGSFTTSGKHDGRELPNADRFSECLVRLPMYYELTPEAITTHIAPLIHSFFAG